MSKLPKFLVEGGFRASVAVAILALISTAGAYAVFSSWWTSVFLGRVQRQVSLATVLHAEVVMRQATIRPEHASEYLPGWVSRVTNLCWLNSAEKAPLAAGPKPPLWPSEAEPLLKCSVILTAKDDAASERIVEVDPVQTGNIQVYPAKWAAVDSEIAQPGSVGVVVCVRNEAASTSTGDSSLWTPVLGLFMQYPAESATEPDTSAAIVAFPPGKRPVLRRVVSVLSSQRLLPFTRYSPRSARVDASEAQLASLFVNELSAECKARRSDKSSMSFSPKSDGPPLTVFLRDYLASLCLGSATMPLVKSISGYGSLVQDAGRSLDGDRVLTTVGLLCGSDIWGLVQFTTIAFFFGALTFGTLRLVAIKFNAMPFPGGATKDDKRAYLAGTSATYAFCVGVLQPLGFGGTIIGLIQAFPFMFTAGLSEEGRWMADRGLMYSLLTAFFTTVVGLGTWLIATALVAYGENVEARRI